MKKKKYEGLAMEVVGLTEDVITTSVTFIDCNSGNSSIIPCSQPDVPPVIHGVSIPYNPVE